MDITQYAAQSRLPRKVLNWMVTKQIIENPLSHEDLLGLSMLEKVWGSREYLRSQLARFSTERRLKLIASADIETKWERYAYSRFCNLQSDERLPMKKVIDEVELTFNFQLKPYHIRKLYRVRKRVYNERFKASQMFKNVT